MSAHTEQPPATPEEIWAILREMTRKQKEADERAEKQREEDRLRAEQDREKTEQERERSRLKAEQEILEIRRMRAEIEEIDRLRREEERIRSLEADKLAKEADLHLKRMEELFTTPWSQLVDSLVGGKLAELLRAWNIDVHYTSGGVKCEHGPTRWEYNVVTCNDEEAVVVKVKTAMDVTDVREFLADMEFFKKRVQFYQRYRVYGAMAYLSAEDEEAALFAERQGLFVIRATGDSASIINKDAFRPKSFD